MRQTKKAFHWIVGILHRHKIPFQITGGLAAKAYGSKRKLADIDIDLDQKYFKTIFPEIKNFIKKGPNRYRDNNWDIYGISLKYENQIIDLCGTQNVKIFDKKNKKWISLHANFKKRKMKNLQGLQVPVQDKKDLIEYKTALGRKVDKIDVSQISQSRNH